ncbi:hypothetical protein HD554DRAFT_1602064 [Boletus coccyginus]|nr:hypothetical protein HD554DRAFT_1602064 [Boletus coccyginus]
MPHLPSQAESAKSSSLTEAPRPRSRWLCPWLPAECDIRHTHEVQSGYQRHIVRLMFAAFVLCGCSAISFLSDDCQASFSFIPASRAISLAGLLTQLIFYYGSPSHIPKALSSIGTEETPSRAIVFFASLWLPFAPFVLSIILLCFGTNPGACIPPVWGADHLDAP